MKVIKLYTPWCGPCKVLENMLIDNNIEHESVNIESAEGEELAAKYGVRAVPTMLVFDENNNLLRKKTGIPASSEDLTKFVYEAN